MGRKAPWRCRDLVLFSRSNELLHPFLRTSQLLGVRLRDQILQTCGVLFLVCWPVSGNEVPQVFFDSTGQWKPRKVSWHSANLCGRRPGMAVPILRIYLPESSQAPERKAAKGAIEWPQPLLVLCGISNGKVSKARSFCGQCTHEAANIQMLPSIVNAMARFTPHFFWCEDLHDVAMSRPSLTRHSRPEDAAKARHCNASKKPVLLKLALRSRGQQVASLLLELPQLPAELAGDAEGGCRAGLPCLSSSSPVGSLQESEVQGA